MSEYVPDPEPAMPNIKKGIYEHYKGGRYEILGTALHTETKEPLVVYRPLYDSSVSFWVRPYDMFVETIIVDGKSVPRFRYIENIEA